MVILAMFLELVFIQAVSPISHGMAFDTQYRHTERIIVFKDYAQHPSPETKARWQQELSLMHKHEDWKWELKLALFVAANGFGFYWYFRCRD